MCTRTIPIAALVSISLVLSACAGSKEAVLPQDGPIMREIYHQHFERMRTETEPGSARARRIRSWGAATGSRRIARIGNHRWA